MMNDLSARYDANPPSGTRRGGFSIRYAIIGILALALVAYFIFGGSRGTGGGAPPTMLPASVVVSKPMVRNIAGRIGFLGQFSAIDRIELRAQVGGTLTEIDFKDGQIVHKGDLLFVIDPRPYEIRLAEATAQLQTAKAREALSTAELYRAQELKKTSFGTAENVDQRLSDQNSAIASIASATAAIRDAQLDIEYCHVTAPFTGRISDHLVSIGNLVSGSRAGASATTLLTTLVSLDPIHLDFDMSESDYLAFARARALNPGPLANVVRVSLSDEKRFTRTGTLDFVDNSLDRASGTIHARATVPNADFFLVPGEFARIEMAVAPPAPVLMLPDAAVMLDQSQHVVMTVAPDGTVIPKPVETGDIRGGLRIIRAGLSPDDHVIIEGLMHAMPGTKVAPQDGTIHFDAASDSQG